MAIRSTMGLSSFFFFFNDTATTEIYTLSLHDALPISPARAGAYRDPHHLRSRRGGGARSESTRLNSSHSQISYAVFCLKKKKKWDDNPVDYGSVIIYLVH